MGRKAKITKEQLWDYLADNATKHDVTYQHIADDLQVCRGTVRKYVKQLIEHGWCIVPTKDGVRMVDADVLDNETAELLMNAFKWAWAVVKSMSIRTEPIKLRIPDIRKALPNDRTTRRMIREMNVRINRLIDAIDIEDDDAYPEPKSARAS